MERLLQLVAAFLKALNDFLGVGAMKSKWNTFRVLQTKKQLDRVRKAHLRRSVEALAKKKAKP